MTKKLNLQFFAIACNKNVIACNCCNVMQSTAIGMQLQQFPLCNRLQFCPLAKSTEKINIQ